MVGPVKTYYGRDFTPRLPGRSISETQLKAHEGALESKLRIIYALNGMNRKLFNTSNFNALRNGFFHQVGMKSLFNTKDVAIALLRGNQLELQTRAGEIFEGNAERLGLNLAGGIVQKTLTENVSILLPNITEPTISFHSGPDHAIFEATLPEIGITDLSITQIPLLKSLLVNPLFFYPPHNIKLGVIILGSRVAEHFNPFCDLHASRELANYFAIAVRSFLH